MCKWTEEWGFCLFVCLPWTMESIHLNVCRVRTFRCLRRSTSGSGRRRSETRRGLTVEWRSLHVAAAASLIFLTTGGRTVLCQRSRWPLPRHLKRQFLLTHKEELMESPFFIPVGPRACWTFKLAFSCPAPARHEGSAWIKHLTDIFSHPQPLPLFPFAKNIIF